MSDIRISQLTALTTPASGDLLLVNDVSDASQSPEGSTKSITYNNLLGGTYSRIFNVKTYGAVGDGTTDDTTAINSAYTALVSAGGGTLLFPVPDSYYKVTTGTLSFSSTVEMIIQGPGKDVACLKTSAVAEAYIINISGQNIHLKDVRVDGNYTSGASAGFYGLVSLSNATNIEISDCYVVNAKKNGIQLVGDCSNIRIHDNVEDNCYASIYGVANTTANTTLNNIHIYNNTAKNCWDTTGNDQTGGIKLAIGETGLVSSNIRIHDNYFYNVGCLGVEVWGGGGRFNDVIVCNNVIKGDQAGGLFGVSLNDSQYSKAFGNIVDLKYGTYGVEIANACENTHAFGNTVKLYDINGNPQTVGAGIVIDYNGTTPPEYCSITDNHISGTYAGVQMQGAVSCKAEGNTTVDCSRHISLVSVNYVGIKNNSLLGNCTNFLFIDGSSENMTDIEFSGNTLLGAASGVGLYGYNNSGTKTITNLKVTGNNVISATAATSYSWDWSSNEIINLHQNGNFYKTGGSQIVLPDYLSYVPTLTNVTLGNGILTAQYARNGQTVEGDLYFKYGSSSSVSGSVIFSLPLASRSYPGTATLQVLGQGRAFDSSAGTSANVFVNWKTTTTAVISVAVASGTYLAQTDTSSTVPWTWAENDEIHVQFKYDLP